MLSLFSYLMERQLNGLIGKFPEPRLKPSRLLVLALPLESYEPNMRCNVFSVQGLLCY